MMLSRIILQRTGKIVSTDEAAMTLYLERILSNHGRYRTNTNSSGCLWSMDYYTFQHISSFLIPIGTTVDVFQGGVEALANLSLTCSTAWSRSIRWKLPLIRRILTYSCIPPAVHWLNSCVNNSQWLSRFHLFCWDLRTFRRTDDGVLTEAMFGSNIEFFRLHQEMQKIGAHKPPRARRVRTRLMQRMLANRKK
jgi:hypothetical protein